MARPGLARAADQLGETLGRRLASTRSPPTTTSSAALVASGVEVAFDGLELEL